MDKIKTRLLKDFASLVTEKKLSQNRLERIVNTVANRQRGLLMFMEGVQNPHNLSAIARSCDAFGVQKLIFTEPAQGMEGSFEDGEISSATASKWLDFEKYESVQQLEKLKAEGWHLVGTWVNEDAQSLYEVDFIRHEKIILMMGNEWAGLSPQAVNLADTKLYIPMLGMLESFNVSVAASLCLYEITRQRRASQQNFNLPYEEAKALTAELIKRSRNKG